LKEAKPNFGFNGFGETIFYRTYSRVKSDGTMETWNDCVLRVIEGVMSIRKDWYIKHRIKWDESAWQHFAHQMAIHLFKMYWLPPGRGLWAMGTSFMYERGSMCLYNCAATEVSNENFANDCHWIMDSLMCGVGVGFHPLQEKLSLNIGGGWYNFVIEDTRESWCDSVAALIRHFVNGEPMPIFKYIKIRKKGAAINGFGGKASGPEPLIYLHQQICDYFDMFQTEEWYNEILLKADIVNAIGCCVVAGNVRRSAELCSGYRFYPSFLDLKNYRKYPHRKEIGWMSNNSVYLEEDEDFDNLKDIAHRVINNGEPGYINLKNLKYGRLDRSDCRHDYASLFNPCGEIPLEHREVCNVVETAPTRCPDFQTWLKACEYAMFYTCTVSLLPTHRSSTNKVVGRNRRVGLSIMDWTGWVAQKGLSTVIRYMQKGYDHARQCNRAFNFAAGVPESLRITTIKPGGTTPKLAGLTPGIGHPTHTYTLRRVRVSNLSPICERLISAGVPYELDINQPDSTWIFEFPILQGPAKPASEITLFQQAMNLVTVQRHWADNAVSNTLFFRKEETESIEFVLSAIAGQTKSVSLMEIDCTAYPQLPEEYITKLEYEQRLSTLKPIDWSSFISEDTPGETYCTGPTCELPVK